MLNKKPGVKCKRFDYEGTINTDLTTNPKLSFDFRPVPLLYRSMDSWQATSWNQWHSFSYFQDIWVTFVDNAQLLGNGVSFGEKLPTWYLTSKDVMTSIWTIDWVQGVNRRLLKWEHFLLWLPRDGLKEEGLNRANAICPRMHPGVAQNRAVRSIGRRHITLFSCLDKWDRKPVKVSSRPTKKWIWWI